MNETLAFADSNMASPEAERIQSELHLVPPPNVAAAKPVHEDVEHQQSFELDHFKAFMYEAQKYDLLTADQEIKLGREVQAGQHAANRLANNNYRSKARRTEDEQLSQRGQVAKQQFMLANLRLVAKEAYRYYRGHPLGRKFGLMDLYQEGSTGLNRAIEKFDPEMGNKFSTYATWWIRQAIMRGLDDTGSTIRLPVPVSERLRKLSRLEEADKSDARIAADMGVDQKELGNLRNIRSHLLDTVSLDKPITADYGQSVATLGEVLADPQSETAFELDELSVEGSQSEIPLSLLDNSDSVDSATFADTLRQVLSAADIRLLDKITHGEDLDTTQKRQLRRLNGLLEHPVVRAKLKPFRPAELKVEKDWRDEGAACIGFEEIFIATNGTAKDKARKICGSCAVQASCEAYFLENLPEKGRWAGGITRDELRERSKKQKVPAGV